MDLLGGRFVSGNDVVDRYCGVEGMARGSIRMLATSLRDDGDRLEDLISEPDVAAQTDPLEALYREHSLHVFRYLRARVPSDDEAAELTAVTFERAINAHGRLRDEGAGERAWLIRIARNASIDAARVRHRDITDHERAAASPSTGMSVESLTELKVLVASLPEPQRDALHLRYAGGLTAREIRLVLDKSEAAAQKLMSRALATLREAYPDGR